MSPKKPTSSARNLIRGSRSFDGTLKPVTDDQRVSFVHVDSQGHESLIGGMHPDLFQSDEHVCGQCGTLAGASKPHTCDRRALRRVQRNEMLARARLLPATPKGTNTQDQ